MSRKKKRKQRSGDEGGLGNKHSVKDPHQEIAIVQHPLVPLFLLIVITLTAYLQVYHFDFINFDDTQYVTDNKQVQRGLTWSGLQWAFTTNHAANWHPLTWVSLMLDVELFGINAGAFHIVNVLYHILNSILLMLLLWRTTFDLWRSFFVAAFFAIHPLHVESVAWIAERKDVLSTLFWLLTMLVYAKYVQVQNKRWYMLLLLVFWFGLMAKQMLMTLPLVLLLFDLWPLCRFQVASLTWINLRKLLIEKIPLCILSLLGLFFAYLAQQAGKAVTSFAVLPLSVRVENAIVSYVRYLWQTIWPVQLAVFYPHPGPALPNWHVLGSLVILGGLTWFVKRAGREYPFLIAGWGWYLISLVPVIGLIQLGAQAHADRYSYIPLIGVFWILVWFLPIVSEIFSWPRFVNPVLGILTLGILVHLTIGQVSLWRDSRTLFEHAYRVTADNFVVHKNLGAALAEDGETRAALAHYERALHYEPDDVNLYYNIGNGYKELNQMEEAVSWYRTALEKKPDHAQVHLNLGNLLSRMQKFEEAQTVYEAGLLIEPEDDGLLINLGNALAVQKELEDAIKCYQKAILISPTNPDPYLNLGNAFAEMGLYDRAIPNYQRALKLNPRLANGHCNLGYVYLQQGKREEAEIHLKKALRLDPNHGLARMYLSEVGKRKSPE